MPTGPLCPAAFVLRDGAGRRRQRAFSGLGRSFWCEVPKVLYYKFLWCRSSWDFTRLLCLKKTRCCSFSRPLSCRCWPWPPIQQISRYRRHRAALLFVGPLGLLRAGRAGLPGNAGPGENQLVLLAGRRRRIYSGNAEKREKKGNDNLLHKELKYA